MYSLTVHPFYTQFNSQNAYKFRLRGTEMERMHKMREHRYNVINDNAFHDLLLIKNCIFFSRFRDFRPTSMEKSQESLRLRIYEVYAWGMPSIITIVAAVLDNLPESPTDGFLRPRFGENKCWFYGEFL